MNARRGRRSAAEGLEAVDFHLTYDSGHDRPDCWGQTDFRTAVDTATALRIVYRVADFGVKRIVFTGGDPLNRPDIRLLILYAYDLGLEISVATPGDKLGRDFLESVGCCLANVSLPLDGSCEAVNCRTRGPGHFAVVREALASLRHHPDIGVTICTAITRHNVDDVPGILRLVEEYAKTTDARVRCEVHQVSPTAACLAPCRELLVSDEDFAALRDRIWTHLSVATEFVGHRALGPARVTIFPDGRLVIPRGWRYYTRGRFLEVADLGECLDKSRIGAGLSDAIPDNTAGEQGH